MCQKVRVFLQVSVYDPTDHALVSLNVFPYSAGLKKQKDSLRSVFISVVLATNLMDNLVTKSHVAERPGLPRFSKYVLATLYSSVNFLSDSQVVRIRLAVD
jgi:hypothetical protein